MALEKTEEEKETKEKKSTLVIPRCKGCNKIPLICICDADDLEK